MSVATGREHAQLQETGVRLAPKSGTQLFSEAVRQACFTLTGDSPRGRSSLPSHPWLGSVPPALSAIACSFAGVRAAGVARKSG